MFHSSCKFLVRSSCFVQPIMKHLLEIFYKVWCTGLVSGFDKSFNMNLEFIENWIEELQKQLSRNYWKLLTSTHRHLRPRWLQYGLSTIIAIILLISLPRFPDSLARTTDVGMLANEKDKDAYWILENPLWIWIKMYISLWPKCIWIGTRRFRTMF